MEDMDMGKFTKTQFIREVVVTDGNHYDGCDFTECVVIGDDEEANTSIANSKFNRCLFVGEPMMRAIREIGAGNNGVAQ